MPICRHTSNISRTARIQGFSYVSRSRRNLLTRALSRANDIARLIAFLIFEYLLPKRNRSWCFCTWNIPYPHTIDNPRGVFESVKADPTLVKIILLKSHHTPDESLREGTNVFFVNVESLRGAYLLARSRVIILGYSLGGLCTFGRHVTNRHNIIQLWHGIPLKRIGKLFPGEHFWDSECLKYAATICSAPEDQNFMTTAFSPTPNVWLTGLPRNDLILAPIRDLPNDYRQQLAQIRNRIAGRRLILYAPTWRDNNNGIYPFSESQLDALKTFLTAHNAVIAIRAHANRRPNEAPDLNDFGSNIFFLNDIPDVNLLLRITDVLITDYSSIYIDFLLTGRPILNFAYDLDTYANERGFLYPLTEAMPNKPFRTFDELLVRLDAALHREQLNLVQYRTVRSLFHGHTGSSSAAVAARINELNETPLSHHPQHNP